MIDPGKHFRELKCTLCGVWDFLYDADGEYQCVSCAEDTIKKYPELFD